VNVFWKVLADSENPFLRAELTVIRLSNILLSVLLALSVTGSAWAQGSELNLPGLDGGGLSESDLVEGDTTIIIFWASWSPRCKDIFERSNAIAAEWKGRARVITVNFQEDLPEIRAFLRGRTARVPVFRDPDGRFSKKHSVTTLPSMLIYEQGRIAFQGRLPEDPSRVIAQAVQRR